LWNCARRARRLAPVRRLALAGSAFALLATPALADDQQQPTIFGRDTFGEVGILETPSARMNPDGEIAVTVAAEPKTYRVNFTFQVLPWLEGSFRYSHLDDFGTTGSYYDRSFGMKLRFFQEGEVMPEVSLGIRDIIGTGIYGSEYIVASKTIGDFDVSGGMGWGRLSDIPAFRNPLALLFPSFNNRAPFTGQGGQVNFGNFFHGRNVGLFGGVIWHTPIDGLDLLAEYNPDKYKREVAFGNATWKSPIDAGVSYHLFRVVSLTAGWLRGTAWTGLISVSIDPTKPIWPFRIDPVATPPTVRDPQQQEAALNAAINPNGSLETIHTAFTAPPPANPGELALAQTLMSEVPNVHDFEVSGSTLMVNVSQGAGAPINCALYARAAYGTRHDLSTIAITNLSDPTGDVTVCPTPVAVHNAQLASFRIGGAQQHPQDGIIMADAVSPAPPPPRAAGNDPATARVQLTKEADKQGITIRAAYLGGAEALIYYENRRYYSEAEAAGRLGRILMAVAPPEVEIFRLIVTEHGRPLRQFTLARSALERVATVSGSTAEVRDAVDISYPDLENPLLDEGNDKIFPLFHWSIGPRYRQSVFDPNAPYQYQIYLAGLTDIDILPGLTASTKLDLNLYNNFTVTGVNTSVLPHVRSDIDEYLMKGATGIGYMMLAYRDRISPDIFTEVEAGLLEDMFAGAGGQMIWRPEDSRIAVGADLYHVWQRGFDRLLDLRQYNVTTGHISIYYQSPWYGLNFNVHAGRYLAGDYGGTFELTRRFDTGVEVGAFATFTNVPFKEFGEGSFDKGIIIRIPLEWGIPAHSTTVEDLTLRSLSRDGGQRLANDDSLYEETLRTSYGEIIRHTDDVTNP
jgi:hypothetical protein